MAALLLKGKIVALYDPALRRNELYAWDQWLVWVLGKRPWPASFMIAGMLLVSYWTYAWAFGLYDDVELGAYDTELVFGFGPYEWAAIVASLLGGFATTVMSYAIVAERVDIEDTACLYGLDASDLAARLDAHVLAGRRGARTAGFIGLLLGFIGIVAILPGGAEVFGFQGPYNDIPTSKLIYAGVWFAVVTPVWIYLLGKALNYSFRLNQFWADIRRDHLTPDIFDPMKLRPITRAAMRGAFMWVIGTTIGSLFFLSQGIDRTVMLPFFIGIGIVAVASLIFPLLGVHRQIVAEKDRQLHDVREALKRNWARIKAADDEEAALVRLGGLLALEQRIETAREWPIDVSTLSRFAFYLAIPLVSWIGGALMERAVDAAIG